MADAFLGRYRLLSRIAVGGMGEVYLATADGAANFSKKVAIKRILPHLANNPDFVAKFIDEANLMVQLTHGNIVPVLELADQGGELFLVMEYVPGRDLRAVIKRFKKQEKFIPTDLAIWLLSEICAGLHYAHRKTDAHGASLNIVHRDVSPSNVVLGSGGEVKLVDFGIARARGRLQNSVSGALQGKFVYMSPEQARGDPLNPQSDVFSAGLILYELLTGIRPFAGDSETETLERVKSAVISAPTGLRPELRGDIDALVMKALTRDPRGRYEDAAEMGHALRQYLAMTESRANGQALAESLSQLFPEGVVPTPNTEGWSFDQALVNQLDLDGLSDSRNRQDRTFTRSTGPNAILSRPPEVTPSQSDSYLSPIYVRPSDSEASSNPRRGGLKRAAFFGLSAGILATSTALLWNVKPEDAHLKIRTVPQEASVTFTLDGVEMQANDVVNAGQAYSLCAKSDGYSQWCKRIRVQNGLNVVDIKLDPSPELIPEVSPKNVDYKLFIDRVPTVDIPTRVRLGDHHVVCVEAVGYTAVPPCHRVTVKGGTNRPRFELKADKAPTPDVEVTRTAEPTALDAKPKSQPLAIRITTIPTAEVWEGTESIGITPLAFELHKGPTTLTLRAKGYADTPFEVHEKMTPGERRVDLMRLAYLTLRAHPPASQIWIDDERKGFGVVNRLPLSPGPHKVVVRYFSEGALLGESDAIKVELEEGKETRLQPISVVMDRDTE